MTHRLRRMGAVGMLGAVLILGACVPRNNGAAWGVGSSQGDDSVASIHARGGVVLSVASDAFPVMQALIPLWNRLYPGIPVALSSPPTIISAVQVNTYIAVDLVINDALQVQKDLVAQGVISGKGYPFAATTLDFVTPASNPGRITRLQDTARPGLKLVNIQWPSGVAEFTNVALEAMMRDPAFKGANIPCADNYATCTYGNMAVSAPDGISAGKLVVNPGLSGVPLPSTAQPLDGSFIYHTDYLEVNRQLGAGSLTALPVPTNFAPPHAWWVAVGAYETVNKTSARTFQAFLFSPAAQAVLRSYGYLPPSGATPPPT